jgi:hypothetical protein
MDAYSLKPLGRGVLTALQKSNQSSTSGDSAPGRYRACNLVDHKPMSLCRLKSFKAAQLVEAMS